MPESEGPAAPPSGGEGDAPASLSSTTSTGTAHERTSREGEPQGQGPGPQATALTTELVDRVVEVVGWLKARTTVRVVTALRAIVYGLVVVIAVVTALVLAALGLVRMWDAYVPVHPLGRRVWLGYVVLGGLLFLAGVALLSRRRRAGKG